MASNNIALDFDCLYTNIYKAGYGVVLSEPTVAAVSGDGKYEVKSVGSEAKKIIGKTTENTKIVFPVFEGEIVNERVAAKLLNAFLTKTDCLSGLFGLEAVCSVPCGVDANMLNSYSKTLKNAGITKVHYIEAPLLSALGQRIPISDDTPCFVIDMAGGTTNIASLTLDGIIAGVSINYGANKITTDIIDYIAEIYGIQIGILTAEKIKNEIGSLDECDELSTVINGRDIKSGKPRTMVLKANEVIIPIRKYFDKISEIALSILSKLPPEVSAEIRNAGVYISGISSTVYGLEKYYKEKLDMKVNIDPNSKTTVALGGGIAISDSALIKKIAVKID